MEEEKGLVFFIAGICALFLVLGLVQFAQIIQWLWLNVSITVK